jgi:hypothetical protein
MILIGSALTENVLKLKGQNDALSRRKIGEKKMNRIVLYTVINGCVVPIRKAYKKARFKRKMGRYQDWNGFHKNGR